MKDKISTAAKLALPIIVAISAVYEYFYFKGLGVDLQNSPLGTADFLRGWLVWSPVLIPFIAGNLLSQILVIGISTSSIDGSRGPIERSPASIRMANSIFWGLFTSGVCILVSYVIAGEYWQFALQSSVPIFSVAAMAKIPTKRWSPQKEKSALTNLMLVAFIGYFALYGFAQGTSVIDEEFDVKNIESRQTTKVDGVTYDVVRVFDQWTLARQRPKHYIWIHNQSEHIIEFQAGRRRYQGLRCIWDENGCYINNRERESFQ